MKRHTASIKQITATIPIIDKKIPIPPHSPRSGAPRKYPLNEMNIGDSFLWPGAPSRVVSAVSWYGKRNPPAKFTVRKVDGGVRVWRVK